MGLRTFSQSRIPSVTSKGVGLVALAMGVSKEIYQKQDFEGI